MSISGAMSAYEKMLKNPANRRSTSGELKQPMPKGVNAQGQVVTEDAPTIEDADDLWIKGLDKRMAARKASKAMNETVDNNKVLNELREVKEMLKLVLDANLKLLKKL